MLQESLFKVPMRGNIMLRVLMKEVRSNGSRNDAKFKELAKLKTKLDNFTSIQALVTDMVQVIDGIAAMKIKSRAGAAAEV